VGGGGPSSRKSQFWGIERRGLTKRQKKTVNTWEGGKKKRSHAGGKGGDLKKQGNTKNRTGEGALQNSKRKGGRNETLKVGEKGRGGNGNMTQPFNNQQKNLKDPNV